VDNIVLKALRKDPSARYLSVEQFSEDIRRHLEGRPVTARSGTLPYRSAKFFRRNRAVVLASLLTAVLLLAVVGMRRLLPVSRDRATNRPIESTTAIDSIAVLPFVNASADPGMEYLSDGIAETLMNQLSQLTNLKVASRTSVFRYKGKEQDPQAVGK